MKLHTKDTLDTLTPAKALEFLKEGNLRFINNLKINRDLLQQVNNYKDGQHPFAIILSCMDSRTTVEHVFDQGLGDVFVLRIAGNVLNEDIIGSMEYACGVVGTKLILVLGHSKCGAIKGACDEVKLGSLTQLLDKIQVSIEEVKEEMPQVSTKESQFVEAVTHHNVIHSLEEILDRSELLKGLFSHGKIGLAGAYYDIETGEVEFMKEKIVLSTA
jgi:carbonic anhydrase